MAPFSDQFEMSVTKFETEKLENYKWTYLDNYVCTMGESDFPLTEVTSVAFFFEVDCD
jgi:hypothetical protein